jgi:hypothetical protein
MEPLITSTLIGFAAAGTLAAFLARPNERLQRIFRATVTAFAALAVTAYFSQQVAIPINLLLLLSIFLSRPSVPPVGVRIPVSYGGGAHAAPAGGGGGFWPGSGRQIGGAPAPQPVPGPSSRAPHSGPGNLGVQELGRAHLGDGMLDPLASRVGDFAGGLIGPAAPSTPHPTSPGFRRFMPGFLSPPQAPQQAAPPGSSRFAAVNRSPNPSPGFGVSSELGRAPHGTGQFSSPPQSSSAAPSVPSRFAAVNRSPNPSPGFEVPSESGRAPHGTGQFSAPEALHYTALGRRSSSAQAPGAPLPVGRGVSFSPLPETGSRSGSRDRRGPSVADVALGGAMAAPPVLQPQRRPDRAPSPE